MSDGTISVQGSRRVVFALGKARVVARDSTSFKIAIGGSTTIHIRPVVSMDHFDLRDGDLLTLYTEVLLADRSPR